jgi:hypothetical protein
MDAAPADYISRLKDCYKFLDRSRLTSKQETDLDALEHFQDYCNKALPQTREEELVKTAVRDLYFADKTSFTRCLVRAPHFVLLTEAHAIVKHFGIQELVYIEWHDNKYIVTLNNLETNPRRRISGGEPNQGRRRRGRRGGVGRSSVTASSTSNRTIAELCDRLERLERARSESTPASSDPIVSMRWGDQVDEK